ncbi:MAG TPA: hypothetical protein VIL71_00230 [Spirillospora sp.]
MMILHRPRLPGVVALAAGVLLAVSGAALSDLGRTREQAERVHKSAAAVEAVPDAVAVGLRDVELRRGPDRRVPLQALGKILRGTTIDAVIASSGRQKLRGGCGKAAGVPAQSIVYCFDKKDSVTTEWVPQGVTTISDAVVGERLKGGGRPILVSWHGTRRVRLTVVNPDKRTYRHVLLVRPTMKGEKPTWVDIDIHAGGIAWYGDKLYVADTRRGLREFDTRLVYDLKESAAGSTGKPRRVGLHGGKYYGHGHRYVMPQTGSWRFAQGEADAKCRGKGPLRMSWAAIDRTTWQHVLIAGEWCRPKGPRGRLVTWPARDLSGTRPVKASWMADLPVDRVQGAARMNGHWWFTQGHGNKKRGLLHMARRTWLGWARVTERTISYGPEDLSCHRGQHRLWTVAEYPRKRALWGLPADPCR